METKKRTRLEQAISNQQIQLHIEIAKYEEICSSIRNNPNQLNIQGFWLGDMLMGMETLRVIIATRRGIINDLIDIKNR
jgi:hypothetical protein